MRPEAVWLTQQYIQIRKQNEPNNKLIVEYDELLIRSHIQSEELRLREELILFMLANVALSGIEKIAGNPDCYRCHVCNGAEIENEVNLKLHIKGVRHKRKYEASFLPQQIAESTQQTTTQGNESPTP